MALGKSRWVWDAVTVLANRVEPRFNRPMENPFRKESIVCKKSDWDLLKNSLRNARSGEKIHFGKETENKEENENPDSVTESRPSRENHENENRQNRQ